MTGFKTAIAAAAALFVASTSQAAIVSFSFSSDPTSGFDVQGTVSGKLYGLAESGASAATRVIVETLPSGLGVAAGADLLTLFALDLRNSITITGGVVTAAEILLATSPGTTGRAFLLNYGNINSLNNIEGQRGTSNQGGFSAISFSVQPEAATVPEPGTFGLLGLAMVSAFAAMRRGRPAHQAF
mgnify:CR=1 FL=1